MESYLGTGTFSKRTGIDLPNPVKRLIVRVMSHYRESSGGSCSELLSGSTIRHCCKKNGSLESTELSQLSLYGSGITELSPPL